jgi:Rrf2 family nitric oxide-sensitive transcriptional repressor
MISQTSEYALRAVVHLALCAPEPQTAQQIATATRVPLPYLSKVLQSLGRAGLVHSQRGLHGGCSLAKTPEELSVYEVIQAVDPWQRIHTCPLGLPQHGVNLCPLHKRIDDSLAVMEQAFRESTIAELLKEPTNSPPLCSERITAFRESHQE